MANPLPRLGRAKIVQAIPGATPELVRALESFFTSINESIPGLINEALQAAGIATATAEAAQATADSKTRAVVPVFTGTSPVAVTGVYTSPDGFAGVRNTQVCSVSFTAEADGEALLIFDGRGTFTNSTGALSAARWSVQNDAAPFDGWRRVEQGVAASASATFPVQTTRRFAIVEGVTYTFGLYASKLNAGDTFEINNFEMRAELLY